MFTNESKRARGIRKAENKKARNVGKIHKIVERTKQHKARGAPDRHRHIKTFNILSHQCTKQEKNKTINN